MASGFQSRQHKRRLRVDEWPLEAAYRRMRDVVAAGLRAMDAEMHALRESERVEMVGGTGGPPRDEMRPENGENGMHVEQCSNCDGVGSYEYRSADGSEYPAQCDACHGTGRITYRSAARVAADADADALAARNNAAPHLLPVTFTPDEQARLNVIRSLYRAGHYGEDR